MAGERPDARHSAPPGTLCIVLVQPKQPGNIGAAARAMKTMGLDRLVLVAPPDDARAHPETLRMARAGASACRGGGAAAVGAGERG